VQNKEILKKKINKPLFNKTFLNYCKAIYSQEHSEKNIQNIYNFLFQIMFDK